MTVTRVVPNLPVVDASKAARLYAGLFDLGVRMDLGWVANLGPADAPEVQLQTLSEDAGASCNPVVSIGVGALSDVDLIHERAVAAGLAIVHPPTDEQWGVRRFFFRDPDGNVVNVVANA